MDPIGKQKRIPSNQEREGSQKLIDGGGAKESYTNFRNMKSGTRKADFKTPPRSTARQIDDWKGKTSGENKHTYHNYGD